jgi:thiosulfate reductase cytochrome b subunit
VVILDIKWIYKYSLKPTEFKNTIKNMSIEYVKINIEQRKIFKIALKDAAIDLEKLALLSLIFVVLPIIINGIANKINKKFQEYSNFIDGYDFQIIVGFVVYIIMARFVINSIRQYRKIKLFLEVIEHVNDGKIIVYKDGKKLK